MGDLKEYLAEVLRTFVEAIFFCLKLLAVLVAILLVALPITAIIVAFHLI